MISVPVLLGDRSYDRGLAVAGGGAAGRSAPVPRWDEEGLVPGPSLHGAGDAFDAEARGLAAAGTEPSFRRALQLLVLADAERARVLGLDEVATSLEQVAGRMTG